MKKFFGNYLGICIQNNCPEFRGRIKVWVPHISATIYEAWNRKKTDKKFKFLGRNINSDLTSDVIEELKKVLPWAEYCSPLMGASGSGLYNAFDDKATISDSSNRKQEKISVKDKYKKFRTNKDNLGEKPGRLYEKFDTRVHDAFNNTKESSINNVNKFSHSYTPSTYSNSAKGSFGIPNVGSHVWVFFREGNPLHPVYFGASFGQDDFLSIFNPKGNKEGFVVQDYPQSFENKSKTDNIERNHDNDTYRNKYVFNQKGGSLEIINTDKRETLKWTHYSGSFLEFNNHTTSRFSSRNDQSLILGDKFETVRKNSNLFIERDFDSIIRGDQYIKIGNLKREHFQSWFDIEREIHDLKKLFETRRLQQQGTFATTTFNGSNIDLLGTSTTSPSTQDGSWALETEKNNITQLIEQKTKELLDIEKKLGNGGSQIINITKHKIETIGMVMNSLESFRLDPVGKWEAGGVGVNANGVWIYNEATPVLEYVDVSDTPGGVYVLNVGSRYNVVVGSGGVSMKTTGPIDLSGAIVNIAGQQVNITSPNEVSVDGGKRVHIEGEVVTLKNKLGKQVSIQSNLGVSGNSVMRGGTHQEGELFVQHVTAPVEFQVTEPTTFEDADFELEGIITGTGSPITSGMLVTIKGSSLNITTPHTHYFKNLPLDLKEDNLKVRENAKDVNSTTVIEPKDVKDGYKSSGSITSPPNGPPTS